MDFSEKIKENSNEQLIRIVTDLRNEYQLEAVYAAEKELKNRKLPPEIIEIAKSKIAEQKRIESLNANEDLHDGDKLLAFIFPWRSIGLLTYADDLKAGKIKKIEQRSRYRIYGLLFYVSIILLVYIFS